MHPHSLNVRERLGLRHIKHKDDAICLPVVDGRDRHVLLRAGCIPDLHLGGEEGEVGRRGEREEGREGGGEEGGRKEEIVEREREAKQQ